MLVGIVVLEGRVCGFGDLCMVQISQLGVYNEF